MGAENTCIAGGPARAPSRRYCAGMGRLHHVNLSVPEGGVPGEADFLVSVLGYEPVAPPDDLPMAHWFQYSDGTQIHLSEDPDHRPSTRAHVAVELGPDLDAVAGRLADAGYEIARFDRPEVRVVFCQDPSGNRWELRSGTG